MKLAAVISAAMLLAACDRQPPPPSVEANVANAAAVPPAPGNAAGCADGWTVALDRESFANNGADKHFAAARLALFRTELESAVRGAVDAACDEKTLDPAAAKPIKRVDVHSASGAADPTFSGSDDPSALRLEWVFAEQDLTIPSEMELRGGLICWTDPQSDECAEREP